MTDKPYTDTDVELVARVSFDDFYGQGSWEFALARPKRNWGASARTILDALAAADRLAPAADHAESWPMTDDDRDDGLCECGNACGWWLLGTLVVVGLLATCGLWVALLWHGRGR